MRDDFSLQKRRFRVKSVQMNFRAGQRRAKGGGSLLGGCGHGQCRSHHDTAAQSINPSSGYSRGIRHLQEHRSPNRMRKLVVSRILISPASTFCRLRVAIPAFSASCSCVMPLRTRSRRTFAPKTRILDHSFLFRGTTYYIAESGRIWNDMVHREKFQICLAKMWGRAKTTSSSGMTLLQGMNS